jgi:hypothetical protein
MNKYSLDIHPSEQRRSSQNISTLNVDPTNLSLQLSKKFLLPLFCCFSKEKG